MNTNFNISMENPMLKVYQYLSVIRDVDYTKLKNNISIDERWMVGDINQSVVRNGKIISPREKLKEREFRTLQYCCYIHPDTFSKYGCAMNWYDTNYMADEMEERKPLYKKEGIKLLSGYVKNQESFINIIKNMPFNPNKPIDDISFKRYEKFMFLLKEYGGIFKLSPPLDVDIVWHAHMLDHKAYVKDTREYFGRVLNHDDSEEIKNELKKYPDLLPKLWEKHFGKNTFYLSDPLGNSSSTTENQSMIMSCYDGCG